MARENNAPRRVRNHYFRESRKLRGTKYAKAQGGTFTIPEKKTCEGCRRAYVLTAANPHTENMHTENTTTTASAHEGMGIIELRTLIADKDKAHNPRNLSPWLITTMDKAECLAYLDKGELPEANAKPGRAAELAAKRAKFFGRGGDTLGLRAEPVITAAAAPSPASPAASPAPALDPLTQLVEAVASTVLARIPPPPAATVDETAVRGLIAAELATIKETAAAAATKNRDETNAALAAVLSALSTASPAAKVKARSTLTKKTGKGDISIYDRLLSLCPPGENPGNHALIVGPSGTGKTYQAREFARLHDWHTEAPIGFHKYLEPHHISGAAAPADDGTFAFVSGAFRDGFKAASEGKTACILLDELLRASPEMQESLLTTLDPIPTAGGLVYRYRSGKPEKNCVGWKQEVIECPVDRLTIVATANIGANYGVFNVDEAFWKRFRHIRVERSGSDERQIIAEYAASFGKDKDTVCKMAVHVLDNSRRAVKGGLLQYPACLRSLAFALQQSSTLDEARAELSRLLSETLVGWAEDGSKLAPHAAEAQRIALELAGF